MKYILESLDEHGQWSCSAFSTDERHCIFDTFEEAKQAICDHLDRFESEIQSDLETFGQIFQWRIREET